MGGQFRGGLGGHGQQPPPANWPGRPVVRPSVPGQRNRNEPIDVADFYQRAETARERGHIPVALRLFHRIAELYERVDEDPSVVTPELAWALRRSAELMDRDGDRGVAAERYFAAGDVFSRLAEALDAKGYQEHAAQAYLEAKDARNRGHLAQEAARAARLQAEILAQRRGGLH
jgi:hypothetical protein